MSMIRAVAVGVGHYLPQRVVSNKEFQKKIETSDEWIKSRSGIERRHFAANGELCGERQLLRVLATADMDLDSGVLRGPDVEGLHMLIRCDHG